MLSQASPPLRSDRTGQGFLGYPVTLRNHSQVPLGKLTLLVWASWSDRGNCNGTWKLTTLQAPQLRVRSGPRELRSPYPALRMRENGAIYIQKNPLKTHSFPTNTAANAFQGLLIKFSTYYRRWNSLWWGGFWIATPLPATLNTYLYCC